MKKHFILLGKSGFIYFCWLFTVLFIGLIVAYESNSSFSLLATLIIAFFIILCTYTFTFSYYDSQYLKLPYRKRLQFKNNFKRIRVWKKIEIDQVQINKYQTIHILKINKSDIIHRRG